MTNRDELWADTEEGSPRYKDTKFQGRRETLIELHAETLFHTTRSFLTLYGKEMAPYARAIALEVTDHFYESLQLRKAMVSLEKRKERIEGLDLEPIIIDPKTVDLENKKIKKKKQPPGQISLEGL